MCRFMILISNTRKRLKRSCESSFLFSLHARRQPSNSQYLLANSETYMRRMLTVSQKLSHPRHQHAPCHSCSKDSHFYYQLRKTLNVVANWTSTASRSSTAIIAAHHLFIVGGTNPPTPVPPFLAAHPFILLLTPKVLPTPPFPFNLSKLVSCILGGLINGNKGGFATNPGGFSTGFSSMTGSFGRGGELERKT